MTSQAYLDEEVELTRALQAWTDAVATVSSLRAKLLTPHPGDVRGEVHQLEQQVAVAASLSLHGIHEHPALHDALKGVLAQMADVTGDLGRVAETRASTIRSVLLLFRRPDLPPGSMLDV